ncbi:ATP-dependent DNA helicase II subunit 2 [Purpureocillium lavendulum]|uniref:non-specific serine/threonine protein kinase n=1 Tax=Purpureocillium lavendulum TaxID=1247861 RepID=A0AB34G536_9HYPO|nr:ATP-dependent DNA helicase II subunit 2 [Purpureocillium lavendulum]
MAFTDALKSGANRLKSMLSLSSRKLHAPRAISEEGIARYCLGGYHPVRIGDVFNNGKYKVVSKLGYGVYSTVWLACNLETKRHLALKVLTANSFEHQKDTFELDILRHINDQQIQHPGKSYILGLLDEVEHRGPNGKHVCLVFKTMGPDMSNSCWLYPTYTIHAKSSTQVSTVSSIWREEEPKPYRASSLALVLIEDIDMKPQNILIETPAIDKMFEQTPSEASRPRGSPLKPPDDFYMASTQFSSIKEDIAKTNELSIRMADFGTSSWFNNHLTEWIQPQMLRAPEVILGADWDSKVDIWNLGLVIWELAEGSLLFDGTWTMNAPYSPEAHLAQMTTVFGNFPETLSARSKNRDRYFDADGKLLEPSIFPPCSLEQFSRNPHSTESEKKAFLSFIGSMVTLDPDERPEATKLLESEWLRSVP